MVISVEVFLQICAGIVCAGGALGYLIRGFKFIKKPADDVQAILKKHDEYLDKDNKRLERLEDIMADNTKCLRLIMEAVITMLSHFEDGNHTKELSNEKKKLESYLLGYIDV